MSYEIEEVSVKDGRPYWLYQFGRGATAWYFTSFPQTLTGLIANTWTPTEIRHNEINQTGNVEKNTLDLEFGLSNEFALGMLVPSVQVTTLTVYRLHRGDLADEYEFYWKGRIVGARSSGQKIILTSENIFTSLRRPGCRVRIYRTCRHDHYGSIGCRLDISDWLVNATITAMSGGGQVLTVTAAASEANSRYRYGVIKWGNFYSQIERHVGSTLVLMLELPGLQEEFDDNGPVSIQIAPGCNRVRLNEDFGCLSYDNTINFGGFDKMPRRNPFNGNSII